MSDEKSSYTNAGTLDKKLRAVEIGLQEDGMELATKTSDISAETVGNSIGNVDKIRDILFGGYIREYEKRFKRLEERFTHENTHLRDDISQRIKALEELLDSELDSLGEKAKVERQERLVANQELRQEIQSLKNEVNQRFTQLDEQFTKDVKQLRQHLQSKFQEITVQLRQQSDHLMALLKQEVSQLHEEKVSRTDLAAFFNEFSLRLSKNFNLPTPK